MPRTGISYGTLRSVIEYGLPLPLVRVDLENFRKAMCMRRDHCRGVLNKFVRLGIALYSKNLLLFDVIIRNRKYTA